jgi:hypothetical protein
MNEILKMHSELQKNYSELKHYNVSNPSELDGQPLGVAYDYIKEMSFYLINELDELMIAVGKGSNQIHKPWSSKNKLLRSEEYISSEDVREEAIDALCFMMNIMLAAGITPENIYESYKKVYDKNISRQKDETY